MLDGIQLHIVETLDEALEFKRWLGERHENNAIAVDTETTGLVENAPGSAIRLIQFGDTQQGWAIPWADWRGVALEALNGWEGDVIYHNMLFERRWLEEHSDFEMDIARSYDTMIAGRILDPTASAALKVLSNRYIDKRAAVGQRELDEGMASNGWTWATVPVTYPPYWLYAGLDTVLTSRLWDTFKDKIGPGGPYHEAMTLEMAVLDVSHKMWRKGMRVDMDYAHAKRDELTSRADQLKSWAKESYGGLLISSPAQLGAFFEQTGMEIENRTPTGKPKIDKDFLNLVLHPDTDAPDHLRYLAEAVLEMRRATKFASSYFDNFIRNADSDGIIRPNINTMAARTGRQSIREPALQTLPKSDKVVRNAILPHDEEELLVSVDLDQVEGRIFANLSGDSQLQQAFIDADANEGADFFTNLGAQLYQDPSFDKNDDRRRLVKGFFYGTLYGAGTKKSSETAGVPLVLMEDLAARMKASYPGMSRFMQEIENVLVQRQRKEGAAYVKLRDGRRLPVDSEQLYAGLNYTIQGTASVHFKRAQVRLDQSGWGQYALVPVHDEIVFSVPKDLVKDALYEIPEIMRDETGGAVPYTAGGEGGFDRWGGKIVG